MRRHSDLLPKALVLQLRAALRQRSPRLRMSWGVTAIKSDVLDTQARSSLFHRIKNEFGPLDILFANAGIANFSPIQETLEEDFDDVMRTNVTAVFLTVQAALALMARGHRLS